MTTPHAAGDHSIYLHLVDCSQPGPRYAILDGREQDLDAGLPVSLVPVISKVGISNFQVLDIALAWQ